MWESPQIAARCMMRNAELMEVALTLCDAMGYRTRLVVCCHRRRSEDGDWIVQGAKEEPWAILRANFPVFVLDKSGRKCNRVEMDNGYYIPMYGVWRSVFGRIANRWSPFDTPLMRDTCLEDEAHRTLGDIIQEIAKAPRATHVELYPDTHGGQKVGVRLCDGQRLEVPTGWLGEYQSLAVSQLLGKMLGVPVRKLTSVLVE
jgi:hypothetical protein